MMNLYDIYQIIIRLPGYEHVSDLLIWNYAMTHSDLELFNEIISDHEFNQIVQRLIVSSDFKQQFNIHDFDVFFKEGWLSKCEIETQFMLRDFIIDRFNNFSANDAILFTQRHAVYFNVNSREFLKLLASNNQFIHNFWYAYIDMQDTIPTVLKALIKIEKGDKFKADKLRPYFSKLVYSQTQLFQNMTDDNKNILLDFLVHFFHITENFVGDFLKQPINETLTVALVEKINAKLNSLESNYNNRTHNTKTLVSNFISLMHFTYLKQ